MEEQDKKNELTLDLAWKNIIAAVYAFNGNRQQHEILEASMRMVQEKLGVEILPLK